MFLLGHWTDFNELEETLSLPELEHILTAKSKSDMEDRKFMAAMQGIELEPPTSEPGFIEKFKDKRSSNGGLSGFGYSQEG